MTREFAKKDLIWTGNKVSCGGVRVQCSDGIGIAALSAPTVLLMVRLALLLPPPQRQQLLLLLTQVIADYHTPPGKSLQRDLMATINAAVDFLVR